MRLARKEKNFLEKSDMKKVKSGSDISFSFNVKVTDKTTVDEIIREASDIIKVRFAEYKVEPEADQSGTNG